MSKLHHLFNQTTEEKEKKSEQTLGQMREREKLTRVRQAELPVVPLSASPSVCQRRGSRNGRPVSTRQNARSGHFYWARENSQSKLQ